MAGLLIRNGREIPRPPVAGVSIGIGYQLIKRVRPPHQRTRPSSDRALGSNLPDCSSIRRMQGVTRCPSPVCYGHSKGVRHGERAVVGP
jgi:hypothetical protein